MKPQETDGPSTKTKIAFTLIMILAGILLGFLFKKYNISNELMWLFISILTISFFIDKLITFSVIGFVTFVPAFFLANLGFEGTIDAIKKILDIAFH